MLVDGDLIGTIDAAVLGIDAKLPGLREVDRVCRVVSAQGVAGNVLDGNHTTILGGDGDKDMLQVTVCINRVCVEDSLLVLVDVERRGISDNPLIDRVLTTLGGGMDISVHGRQAEGGDGCVVIIDNPTVVVCREARCY